MFSRLKKVLQERLSLGNKLAAKQLLVGSVGTVVRVGAYFYRLAQGLRERAMTHGLDWHRAWDLKARPSPATIPPVGMQDLLFLKGLKNEDQPGSPETNVRSSIIIPVFNNAEFTFQCLRSLLREVDLTTTEVIVVNDASTDNTSEMLELFGKMTRVVTNEKNLGFGETCNRGAAVATGRYVVFLNNDTWVMPGWLSELERTIEGNDEVGAVGSMFLYPDGRVQEAGGIVWRSGEAFHYGWCKSPDDHRLNFAREVDCCSAASLLIRKDLFDRLGGFDPLYSPAYYEDTDLCMGVRSLGHKVIYQAASRLIHYEGITTGTDVRVGLKRFQETNREKFRDKWSGVLDTDHLPAGSNTEQAADRRGLSVLVIDDRVPTPDRDAGSGRMMHVLQSLAARCRPVFVSVRNQGLPEYERQLWKIGVETTSIMEYRRLMRNREFRAVIVSRPDVAAATIPALRRRNPGLKIVFDLVDVQFVRLEREHRLTGDSTTAKEAAHYKRIETRVARMADLIWCASTEDQRVMAKVAPDTPSLVLPTIHRLHHHDTPFDEREGLLFLGNMAHRPNADALHYLVREIMPIVRRELPDAVLNVVGDAATEEIKAYPSSDVRILGYVPDIKPLFAGCRLMVAPLRFGAGIKGKIGESLAHGLPVVTTSIGAESMNIYDEQQAMIADTPEDVAAAIVRLYRDRELWQRLAENGQRLIESSYTPTVVDEVIKKSLGDLQTRPK